MEHSISTSSRSVFRYSPAFVSGVFTEFIGNKPLPKAAEDRLLRFIFGPSGVGKTIVAKSMLPETAVLLRQHELADRFLHHIRRREWSEDVLEPSGLIAEIPCFLDQRPLLLQLLTELVLFRCRQGWPTILLDSESNGSVQELLKRIPIELRASILLRFPEGRGRYRFLAHACRERGLSLKHARRLARVEPWSYSRVLSELDDLQKAAEPT